MLLSNDLSQLTETIGQSIANQDFNEATIGIGRLKSLGLDSTLVLALESQLAMAQGNLSIALDLIDLALAQVGDRLDADGVPLHYQRAVILSRLERDAESSRVVDRLIAAKFQPAFALKIAAAIKCDDYALVVQTCQAGILLDPVEIRLWSALASSQTILNDYPAADESVKAILTLDPNNASGLQLAVKVKFRLGQYAKCVLFADRLLKIEPDNIQALSHKFLASIEMGMWEILPFILERLEPLDRELFEYCQQIHESYTADRVDRSTVFNHQSLLESAKVLCYQGETERALLMLESADAFKPNDPFCQLLTATCLVNLGRTEAAVKIYERIEVMSGAETHTFYANYGTALLMLDRYTEAIEQLEQAIALQPCNVEDLNNLAICYGSSGDLDRAIFHGAMAVDLAPTNVEVAICHAGFLLLDKRGEAAIEVAQTTLQIAPLNPKSHYLMAMVLGTQFRFIEAFPFACHYLKAYPECPLGKSLYETIITKIEMDLGVDRAK